MGTFIALFVEFLGVFGVIPEGGDVVLLGGDFFVEIFEFDFDSFFFLLQQPHLPFVVLLGVVRCRVFRLVGVIFEQFFNLHCNFFLSFKLYC